MEDFRAGRMASPRTVSATRRQVTAWVDISTDPDLTVSIVEALRLAGSRVAFTLDDSRRGNAVAQSTGARFYPRPLASGAVDDYKKFDITLTR